jgi:uncharacterized protein
MKTNKTEVIKAVLEGAHVMGSNGLQDYHTAQAIKAACRKQDSVIKFMTIRTAIKNYNLMVSLQGDCTRIWNPSTQTEVTL